MTNQYRAVVNPNLADMVVAQAMAYTRVHQVVHDSRVERYRLDPFGYITDVLQWSPWSGTEDHPGQVQVIDAYIRSIRQQLERQVYLADHDADVLHAWDGVSDIPQIIHVESGHSMGKTKVGAGLVNHFFDCFVPSVIYSLAPTKEQTKDLLWKEIKSDRQDKGLPGRILDLGLDRGPNHFAKGRVGSKAKGAGSERIQGQHAPYMLFVLDEAEGIEDFVFDAVDAMRSSGIVVVLMLANPRTRTSRFHSARSQSNAVPIRMNCLYHPNVINGAETVPGGVTRDWVESMIDRHCTVVGVDDPAWQTFHRTYGTEEEKRVTFRPNNEFLFRVMGAPPNNMADRTIVPVGVYEAACTRKSEVMDPTTVTIGIDVARFGADMGTCYVRYDMDVWRAALFDRKDSIAYHQRVREIIFALLDQNKAIQQVDIRVDGTGGFGGGVIDQLGADAELLARVPSLIVREIHFGGGAHDPRTYFNLVSEMYSQAAETMYGIHIVDPPPQLEVDLCERTYTYMNVRGRAVKKLDEKERFREVHHRSPDDGDGFVLCVAPSFIFEPTVQTMVEYQPYQIGADVDTDLDGNGHDFGYRIGF